MTPRRPLAALVLAAAAASAAAPAHADAIALAGDNTWVGFAVDSLLAPLATPLAWIDDAGTPVEFTFSIGAGLLGTLTVVDAGFAGDTFLLSNLGSAFGATSVVPAGTFEASSDVGLDYDAALADASFSRAVLTLGPGSYRIAGTLAQSVTFGGLPLEATAGAIRLSVAAPVPEPETYALLLAGLGVMGSIARHRRRAAA